MNKIFEALAHPTRRKILEMLKGGSRNAGEIASAFDVAKPTMSGHFAKLKEANLIQADHRGTTIFYSINLSTLEEAMLGFMGSMGVGSAVKGTDGDA